MVLVTWRASIGLACLTFVVSAVGSNDPTHATRRRAHRGKARNWDHEDVALRTSAVEKTESAAVDRIALSSGGELSSSTIRDSPAPTISSKVTRTSECRQNARLGGRCAPAEGLCCEADLVCTDGYCTALCPFDTLEGRCDSSTPCNTDAGYVCQGGRCRPPAGAIRVSTNEACDQGEGNTRFCLPGRGLCSEGICVACFF